MDETNEDSFSAMIVSTEDYNDHQQQSMYKSHWSNTVEHPIIVVAHRWMKRHSCHGSQIPR